MGVHGARQGSLPDLSGAEVSRDTLPPAPRPCDSCPYRRDVAPGVWAEEEYAKLPAFDGETWEQVGTGAFFCHQQDGRLCAGWAGCHDMFDSFGLRMLAATQQISSEALQATLEYESPVPLFESGAEAAAHGRSGIDRPPSEAVRIIQKIERRRGT